MNLLVRTYIKTALLYFLAAFALGLLLVASSVLHLPVSPAALNPVYIHLFVLGWLTQLVFGVAWWMFPIDTREKLKSREWVLWVIYFLLNSGLILRAISEPASIVGADPGWKIVLLASAILQASSGVLFAIIMWERVRPAKLPPRKNA